MTRNFAFYGRVSTEDQQDPESSRGWQLSRSNALIAPHDGVVTAEFFDIGLSRSLPWKRRAQAALLLESFKDPGRGFDAVVIGEPARAFYGNQFGLTFPVFEHYGVELWVPEVGGRVDPGSDAHELVMAMYGGMSKGERNRIKLRVRTSMAAQASTQGRYLGGRPPYGYRLGDAGPHPNPGKAATGQRAHRLEIDEEAAPTVARIFAEYVSGRGVSAIANRLNDEGTPCPSAHDPARNTHRSGAAWVGAAVQAILRNPRYTGYEVWNKQRKDEVLIDVEDVALGHETRMRWNDRSAWIFSPHPVHEAVVSQDVYQQAQQLLASPAKPNEPRGSRVDHRTYLLRGLIICKNCERRMQGTWNNGRAHYRCKLLAADGYLARRGHPRTIYVREDIVDRVDEWLGGLFAPRHRDRTIETIHRAAEDPAVVVRRQAAQKSLKSCDDRLGKYRAALEAGADPVTVTGWIAEVTAEKTRLGVELPRASGSMTKDQIAAIVDQMASLAQLLSEAEAADRAEVYRQLGLRLTYENDAHLIRAQALPGQICTKDGVRGGT